jgi:hypothetical protein
MDAQTMSDLNGEGGAPGLGPEATAADICAPLSQIGH